MDIKSATTTNLDSERAVRCLRLEWWAERVGRLLILGTVVCALVGLSGPGPLSYSEVTSSDQRVRIEYYRLQRYEAPAELKIHFESDSQANEPVRLGISRAFADLTTIESITPPPQSTEADDEQIVYVFQGTNLIAMTFRYKNNSFGSVRYAVTLNDGAAVSIAHFVLP
jgi:hypothetical protein